MRQLRFPSREGFRNAPTDLAEAGTAPLPRSLELLLSAARQRDREIEDAVELAGASLLEES